MEQRARQVLEEATLNLPPSPPSMETSVYEDAMPDENVIPDENIESGGSASSPPSASKQFSPVVERRQTRRSVLGALPDNE